MEHCSPEVLDICASDLSHDNDKCPTEQLRRGSVYSTSQFEGTVHSGGNVWWHTCGHIASIVENQRETATPTFRVVLAPSVGLT